MRKTLITIVFLTAGALAQSGTSPLAAEESRLVVLEHLWNEAQVNRDVHAIQGMIGERFRNTEWDGEFSSREEFLADIRDPKFRPASLAIQDVQVNMYSTMAVITGIYHAKGAYEGKPYDHVGRFTDTWVAQDGKWLCVASHTSLLKK
jgi:hypothetical protein